MNNNQSQSYPVRSYPYQVFYADTDAGGVVYYAQYLRIFEQARTLYIQEYGLTLQEMEERNNIFVCRHAEIDYLSPAKLGDHLLVHTQIVEESKTFWNFSYQIVCPERKDSSGDPSVLVEGSTKIVSCQVKGDKIVPTRIPKWIKERMDSSG